MMTAAAVATPDSETPFEPISLTESGHKLLAIEYLGMDPITDKDRLPPIGVAIGIHAHCEGRMIVHGATKLVNAMVCDRCSIRFEFAKALETYGDLRRSFEFRT